jgi:hypothetical protein
LPVFSTDLGWFMRTAASALLVIVALVLAAIAGPTLWMQRHVIDQAGFVELAGPLGSNKAFQEGLSSLAASQATASLNLPPQLNDLAAAVIKTSARNIYTEPGYGQAWTETLQRSHGLTFAAAGNTEVQGDLQLDVAPLVALVAANVGEDLGVSLPTPDNVVVALEQPQLARLVPVATMLGGWAWAIAIAAVVLLALGVLVARRRSLAVLLAGVGLAAVALLWLFGSASVESTLTGMAAGTGIAKQFGVELAAVARQSWQSGITTTFVAAGVLVAVGVATLMVRGRRTT